MRSVRWLLTVDRYAINELMAQYRTNELSTEHNLQTNTHTHTQFVEYESWAKWLCCSSIYFCHLTVGYATMYRTLECILAHLPYVCAQRILFMHFFPNKIFMTTRQRPRSKSDPLCRQQEMKPCHHVNKNGLVCTSWIRVASAAAAASIRRHSPLLWTRM